VVRLGIIGLGKMGLSHLSIANTDPRAKVVGVCDPTGYVLDVINKYAGFETFGDYRALIENGKPDAVVVATPSRTHGEICRFAVERGIHVFVEKPFCLSVDEGRQLVSLAERAGVVNQVGYHYRFVGAFREVRKLLQADVIGNVHNFRVEAYGPVVLQPKGGTWRSSKTEGGGCLFDYASHAANLTTFLFGMPAGVGGSVMHSVFSKGVDDEVYSTLYYGDGRSGQLCVNWSDETHRKMSLRVEIWGTNGKINADRQECQVYLRDGARPDFKLGEGWSTLYTTELTEPVRYYVRGEEYSAQMDYFIDCIEAKRTENVNSFASALETDVLLDMVQRDAALGPRITDSGTERPAETGPGGWRETLIRWLGGKPALQKVS
jgi:predicted dehydrogenase